MIGSLLAIECSQRTGGVALLDGTGHVRVERFEPDVRHGDVLLPTIDRMCTEADLDRRDLAGCGVSIGPGGFTGLRVSIATARTIAWTLDIPVYGVPSALVVATALDASISNAVVALAGKGTDAWLTGLVRDDAGWRIDRPGALVERSNSDGWFTGTGVLVADEHVPAGITDAAASAGWSTGEPDWDPGACLDVVRRRHESSLPDDSHTLQPIYPRVPEAVSLWEARKRS